MDSHRSRSRAARRPSAARWAVALLLAALACSGPVHAQQDRDSREREALRRVQQALRDAQAENASLQQARAALAAEKDALAARAAGLDDALRRSEGRAAQAAVAQQRTQQLQAEAAELRAQRDMALTQLQALGRQLQEARSLNANLRTLLERSTAAQASLQARNQALYDVGRQAIELYRARDPVAVWSSRNPLLGLEQVRIENAAEALRDRLEAARQAESAPAERTAQP